MRAMGLWLTTVSLLVLMHPGPLQADRTHAQEDVRHRSENQPHPEHLAVAPLTVKAGQKMVVTGPCGSSHWKDGSFSDPCNPKEHPILLAIVTRKTHFVHNVQYSVYGTDHFSGLVYDSLERRFSYTCLYPHTHTPRVWTCSFTLPSNVPPQPSLLLVSYSPDGWSSASLLAPTDPGIDGIGSFMVTRGVPKKSFKNPHIVADRATGLSVLATHLHFDNGGDMPPKAGNAFAVVHVILTNGGQSVQDYSLINFVLHGDVDSINYMPGALDLKVSNTLLGTGKLPAGQKVAGDLAFEVPLGHQTYTLQWTPGYDGAPVNVPLNP